MFTSTGLRLRTALFTAPALGLALLWAGPAAAAGGVPTTPTELFNEYQACSTDASAPLYLAGRAGLLVEGITGDTDSSVNTLAEQFQAWPVSDPTQLITGTDNYTVPGDEGSTTLGDRTTLLDGQTYAWQARSVDSTGAASAWSAPCYVTDDDTFPSAVPTITSDNYPTGQSDQGGKPIDFTFGANGVSDVYGYEFSWTGNDFPVPVASIGEHGIPVYQDPYVLSQGRVKADSLGGTATVSLIPKNPSGFLTLTVASLDRAGNPSSTQEYDIWLKPDGPTVTQVNQPAKFGKPVEFTLTPDPGVQAASPVVSYTVQHNGQTQSTTTVKASSDGTAKLKLALDGATGDSLTVSTTSANGWVSVGTWWTTGSVDTSPTVTSTVYTENGSSGGVGVPGTFTFAPKVTGVANYTYSINWGPTATVKARGMSKDGTVTWTPTESGWYDLEVFATTKGGAVLAPYDYYFTVN